MNTEQRRRRTFLKTAITGTATLLSAEAKAAGDSSPNQRPRIGVVGCGSRWGWQLANGGSYGVGPDFAKFADYVAVCDVDQDRRDAGRHLVKGWSGHQPDALRDYRDMVDRDDIDAIIIFTPDHWHAKIAIEAMRRGKDVYCEKPLTLTIDEGKQLVRITEQTERVLQVGTQQRSSRNFQLAVALARSGRLGKIRRITCGVGGGPTSPPLPASAAPKTLDWNQWLGPAPATEFRSVAGASNETKAWSNNHYEFRWWYEYAGGKLTDWGAHHVDIAMWVLDKCQTGPTSVEPLMVEHPVPLDNGMPLRSDQYNTATKFRIRVSFADDQEIIIDSEERNGLLIEGTEGRIFVNRGILTGGPVEQLASNPLDGEMLASVNPALLTQQPEAPGGSLAHVRNFFDCVTSRDTPTSAVSDHHRSLSVCHLAAIASRLDRRIDFDPASQSILNDPLAQSFLAREKRIGFEIEV